MRLQKCGQCNKRFKWAQISKSLLFSYKPITCSHCGADYKITFSSRTISAILFTLIVLIVPFAREQELSIPFVILVIFIYYVLLLSMILPYIVKYEIQHSMIKSKR
ncbi:TIGR04104 family putative zinc finger protein [Neobacillus vireti]|uniref:TIGR04104 family putative zinc finger protein n=1 Tax=Neobacillus vireti TaxID=220686 RepID=UPI003B58B11B